MIMNPSVMSTQLRTVSSSHPEEHHLRDGQRDGHSHAHAASNDPASPPSQQSPEAADSSSPLSPPSAPTISMTPTTSHPASPSSLPSPLSSSPATLQKGSIRRRSAKASKSRRSNEASSQQHHAPSRKVKETLTFCDTTYYCRSQPHIITYDPTEPVFYDRDDDEDSVDVDEHASNDGHNSRTRSLCHSSHNTSSTETLNDDDSSTETTETVRTSATTATSTSNTDGHDDDDALMTPRLDEDESSTNLHLHKVLSNLEQSLANPNASMGRTMSEWSALGLVRCHMQNKPAVALLCFQEALKCCSSRACMEMAIVYHDMGYCHERLYQNNEADFAYQQAITILDELCIPQSHPRRLATQRSQSRVTRA